MKQVLNTKQDVCDYWSELQFEVETDAWQEFLSRSRRKLPQKWNVMDSNQFIRLVRAAYVGELSQKDRDLIDYYAELTFRNYIKLNFNTIMVGHTEERPDKYLQSLLDDEEERPLEYWDKKAKKYCDWVADDAFSDYGLKPISRLLIPLMLQKNYSLKMQILTEIIEVTHMRGDLAAFFVESGRKTAYQIEVYDAIPEWPCYRESLRSA